jgi:hypothetical protein
VEKTKLPESPNRRALSLPSADGSLSLYTPGPASEFASVDGPSRSRISYAAPHVVCEPLVDYTPGLDPKLDLEGTLAFRRHLWSYGIGVAEAMDTSERGPGGLGWDETKELIRLSVAEAKSVGGRIVCGVGDDHRPDGYASSVKDVIEAYEEQLEFVESVGGRVVLRVSHELARIARTADDYAKVYGSLLSQASEPAIFHWLGELFDPKMAGYWGAQDQEAALETVLGIARDNRQKLDGVKFSLLDRELEVRFRRELPEGVRVYTGDDFDYTKLMKGDDQGYSHGLLGVLDPIAPAAGAAFRALDEGDNERYQALMAATVPLAKRMFEPPSWSYKTGVVFLAYLNGHQDHFRMMSGQEGARSIVHLSDLFRLADEARLLCDAELAVERMQRTLALSGVV